MDKAYYDRNSKIYIARAIAWKKANPEKWAFCRSQYQERAGRDRWWLQLNRNAHSRSKIAKFGPSDLDPDFIKSLFEKQNGKCYWFGIDMIPSGVQHHPLKPSLDRIDNTRGYLRDNVVLTCQFANLGRGRLSAEVFKDFVTYLRETIVNIT